jgi:hypothetical protein
MASSNTLLDFFKAKQGLRKDKGEETERYASTLIA